MAPKTKKLKPHTRALAATKSSDGYPWLFSCDGVPAKSIGCNSAFCVLTKEKEQIKPPTVSQGKSSCNFDFGGPYYYLIPKNTASVIDPKNKTQTDTQCGGHKFNEAWALAHSKIPVTNPSIKSEFNVIYGCDPLGVAKHCLVLPQTIRPLEKCEFKIVGAAFLYTCIFLIGCLCYHHRKGSKSAKFTSSKKQNLLDNTHNPGESAANTYNTMS